ncbi:hypothetical protein ABLN87_22260, partial [Ruegeria sp. SCPT10]
MTNKRPKPEEIVSKLRQVEVLMWQGMSRLDAIRQIGVVEQTYYRWRKRPEYRNHVWSYDFVHCRNDDGKAFRTLNILDEHSRECLAIRVKRKLNSVAVIDALT